MTTPNNREFKPLKSPSVIADCWIDKDNPFLTNTGLTDAQVEQLIIGACGYVNKYVGRYFNKQEADYVFINHDYSLRNFETFVLPNMPVTSITDMYLLVQAQFSEISLQYLELFQDTGAIKIIPYPEQLTNISFNILQNTGADKPSLWVRFTSGYEDDEVPFDVQQATAYVFNYFFAMAQDTSSIESFKTQNYTQTNATPNESPVLQNAHSILNNYKPIHVA